MDRRFVLAIVTQAPQSTKLRSFVAGFFTHLCSGCYLQRRKKKGATGTLVPVQEGHRRHSRSLWFPADVFGLFSNNLGPFSRNLVPSGPLIGFHHPSHYADYLIKPARKTLEALIVKEWPNIQRILASLAQKDVTQATIVRKLSSYARQNQTKKALWELDHIRQTIHILDFIDDLELRQSVQKALNRGEAYHRMRRAISYVNAGKFRVKTEAEQQIWNECSRLIANAIIYYNTLLLSRVYEHKLAANDQDAIEILKGISPVAWRNVNLIGNFDFTTGSSPVDIEALAERYENPDFWRRSLQEAEDDGPAY